MPKGIPKNGINKGWLKKGKSPWNKGLNKETSLLVKQCGEKQKTGKIFICKQCEKEYYRKPSMDRCKNSFCSRKCFEKSIIGRKPWNKGLPGKKGAEANNWQGGKSFEPYSVDWSKTLRRSIRERDGYVCKICGRQQEDYAFDVHHIDYDKKNCNPDNLITLCRSCHIKTNGNREDWIKYFKNKYGNNIKNKRRD